MLGMFTGGGGWCGDGPGASPVAGPIIDRRMDLTKVGTRSNWQTIRMWLVILGGALSVIQLG